ncbi:hypothetical protein K474DRAFT_1383940 [Panus rudis PR-1116 ss-1]|nr:hypothetical protein K474DRAFT_1383940 [Panus rudis PR-1116 ss-1]
MNDIPMKYDIIQLPEITDITKDLMDDLISPPNLDANVLPLGARLFFTYTCLPVWHVPAAFEGTPDEIKSTRDDAMVSRLQDRATMVEEEVIKEVATIRENLATAFPKECIAFCMLNMTVDQLQLRMCVLHAAFENQPEKVIIEYLEKHIRSPIGVLLRNVGRSLLFPERGIPDKQSYVESENMDVDLVFLVGSMQIVWDKLTKLGEEIKREFEEFRKR